MNRITRAYRDLAIRLWCDDVPEDSSLVNIDEWVDGLTEDEAAAFNAMLGENFGSRPDLYWEASHAICQETLKEEA
jgi:hypothetical protein